MGAADGPGDLLDAGDQRGQAHPSVGGTFFYAIRPNGTLRWKLKTGGIIDAAGALSAYDPRIGSAPADVRLRR